MEGEEKKKKEKKKKKKKEEEEEEEEERRKKRGLVQSSGSSPHAEATKWLQIFMAWLNLRELSTRGAVCAFFFECRSWISFRLSFKFSSRFTMAAA